MQVGAEGVDKDGFREHIEYALTQPNVRFIGIGDYTDPVSPSNRKLLRAAFVKGDLYDSFEELVYEGMQRRVDEFVDLMQGTEGKVDAILPGHHYYTYMRKVNGVWQMRTTDQDIAEALGAQFLGSPEDKQPQAVITYSFPPVVKGGERPELKVFLRHGQGSGETFAAPLNQLEKQMRGHSDHVYIIAHHHKLVAAKAVKLSEDETHETGVRGTDAALVAAGSWLRGFLNEKVTYAEDGQMVPLAVGAPIIHVRRKPDGSFRIRVTI